MITYRTASGLTELFQAFQLLKNLDVYYPGFDSWFINKCMPSISSGTDKMVIAENDNQMIGVSIIKNSEEEKKLRCVRVVPEYKGRGVALHLMDRSLVLLDCDKPAVTVAEELFHDWSRIFVNRYDFDLSTVAKGAHRPGKLEYFFNGKGIIETPYGRE
jgi:hypothetical protein